MFAPGAGCLTLHRADAVFGDAAFGVQLIEGDAGDGDSFAAVDACGDFVVEGQELGERSFFGEKP